VILGTGYSQDADYWSLGVITYQCLYGKLPFGEGISQPIQIYDKVLNSKLKFPANVDIGPVKSLIETFLSRNPPLRHYSNPAKLRNPPWLSGLNWVIAS
jgi:serine/threonine protein kinase